MSALYPLTFKPVFQERIWGGRSLQSLYGKALPPEVPIGESWEVCDRVDAMSVVANGPLAGRTLHWLMENHGAELMGRAGSPKGRFPLLVKILDARERLSLQVHPPAHLAAELNGEPKTEMWYFAQSDPGAEIFAGLKPGVTPAEFAAKTRDGTVAECFHRISVRPGDAMFLPSGRVHALGEGVVIFEIQQNSDTTYRVFDWNRTDAQGRKRELHVDQSLRSIDFNDFSPGLIQETTTTELNGIRVRSLVDHELFQVDLIEAQNQAGLHYTLDAAVVVGVVQGGATIHHGSDPVHLAPGSFALLPASLAHVEIFTHDQTRLLLATPS